MKKIVVLASSNKHKLLEIQAILSDFEYELKTMAETRLGDFEIIEDGTTFEENAAIKAYAVHRELGGIALADDSGLEVDYLKGAPGVYSARYAGEPKDDDRNNQKLLDALDGVPEALRTARFVTVLSLVFEDGSNLTVRGEVEGMIGYEPKGTNGFGYDPLFYVPEFKKTFAELAESEKNKVSHRANALQKLKILLEDTNENSCC